MPIGISCTPNRRIVECLPLKRIVSGCRRKGRNPGFLGALRSVSHMVISSRNGLFRAIGRVIITRY